MHEATIARAAALNGGGEAAAGEAAAFPFRRPRSRLSAMLDEDEGLRADVRRRVTETEEPVNAIARALGAPPSTLHDIVRREGWSRPPGAPARPEAEARPGPDVARVRARLLKAIDRQAARIETRTKRKGAEIEERDSRILANLAKSLATLAETGEGNATPKHAEPPNRGEYRAELARRIAAWAEEEEESAPAD